MSISNCIVPENHIDESSADNPSFKMDSHNNVPTTPTTPTTPHSNSISVSPSNQTRKLVTNSEAGVATTTNRNSGSSQTPRASWASLQPFDSEKELEATVSKEIVCQTSLLKKSSVGSSVGELYKSTETKTKKPPPFFDQETREEYEERAFLGKGGYGKVFKVTNKKGDVFALKTFWKDIRAKEIQREIDMLEAAGKHENLVKYFGSVDDPNGKCLLFELCLPRSLDSLLWKRGVITEAEARFFISEIAKGLSHLHGKGLMHRDIKPENIMFAPGMRLRIGDLGLASRYDKKDSKVGAVGTDGFIAPEVVNGHPHTFSMDMYSVGCIAYIMLQGEHPWLTKGDHVYHRKLEYLLQTPECKLKSDAKTLIRKLLDFDPTTRQQLPTLYRERFMTSGYCPKRLGEEVFDREPDLTTEGKRKVEMSEVDEKAKVKIKLDFYDPFCDTAILYRNTDSYEADF
ncbi:Serine/threonine-protein kinase PLK1 [Mortierella sp. AD032]|nr:Serine/threonine-protein kinase PLK1 [Mortierella sp. AD032]